MTNIINYNDLKINQCKIKPSDIFLVRIPKKYTSKMSEIVTTFDELKKSLNIKKYVCVLR